MSAFRALVGLAFLLMSAAGARAQRVTVDYDRHADFSAFNTYAWAKGAQAANPLIDRRIIDSIDWRLSAAGLQRVDGSGDPDLVVVYHAAVATPLLIDTTNLGGWGSGWSWGYGGTTINPVQSLRVGDLAVDIAQLKGKKFIWRGTAASTISGKPDKVQKMVNKALDKMFQKFPSPLR